MVEVLGGLSLPKHLGTGGAGARSARAAVVAVRLGLVLAGVLDSQMLVCQVIQPPLLLVFTWRSEFIGMRDTLVTVRLTERGARETDIEVTHEMATEDEATSHAGGWGQLLARLEAYLEDR